MTKTEDLREQRDTQKEELKDLGHRLDVRIHRLKNWRTLTHDYPFQTLLASAFIGFLLGGTGGVVARFALGSAKNMVKTGAAAYLISLANEVTQTKSQRIIDV